ALSARLVLAGRGARVSVQAVWRERVGLFHYADPGADDLSHGQRAGGAGVFLVHGNQAARSGSAAVAIWSDGAGAAVGGGATPESFLRDCQPDFDASRQTSDRPAFGRRQVAWFACVVGSGIALAKSGVVDHRVQAAEVATGEVVGSRRAILFGLDRGISGGVGIGR